jgi:type VI secretion system protein ImpB
MKPSPHGFALMRRSQRGRSAVVDITYKDAENTTQRLPFVVAVLADLSGSSPEKPALNERRFVSINDTAFVSVMRSMQPQVRLTVPNRLRDNHEQEMLSIDLAFTSMEDFRPHRLVKNIPPLAFLLKRRAQLKQLQRRLQANPELASGLDEVLKAALKKD